MTNNSGNSIKTRPKNIDGDAEDSTRSEKKPVVYVEDPPTPPRWLSYEFIFYYIIIVIGYIVVLKMLLTRSNEYNDGLKENKGIVEGWFLGRKQDLSDTQYKIYRQNFPLLSIGLSIFLFVSASIRKNFPDKPFVRILFYNIISLGFLIFVHGSSTIIVLGIAIINFSISRIFERSKMLPAVTWIFNLIILWTCYIYEGYSFKSLSGLLGDETCVWLDSHKGFLSWETYFKVSMLRFISYNNDYYWAKSKRPVVDLKGKSAYFIAQERHQPMEHYSFSHFLAYIFYIPLYIAGPITTFNAFTAQVYNPQKTYSFGDLVKASIKILLVFLGLEICLHYCYYHSFDKSDVWMTFTGAEVALTGYLVLNFMYVKFLIIWRTFRLFALFDGIDTPENMNRCVNNNYTFTGFWRSWHGAFNKWTIRYLYIPLGGKKTQFVSIWIIFFFIGLWHDLWLSWIAWALLNCVFFSIEIGIMFYFYHPKRLPLRRKWYWRFMVAIAGTFNIFLLMVANLAILHGFENSIIFIHNAFFVPGGPTAFILAYSWLFCGIMVMIELRESEKRSKEIKPF
ncbi:membrane bound O-acyl transferase family protein [Dictyostelium discoideum AX4]|uniref:Membrane bound O-acyl transferase family protein n=1 Tax=Dictyostelium discoideum TaxID=44689 RepID=Q54IP9_DICDI|nr:membrane bound O-acyl transferase family protein [Dictyostelium discoideum AX4]EAL63159.1 membrane bound O-acyl transferase family protein [Dictyostelium discoideum AX4]|eukprot:XP_636665.1 membrane bound O-acyl transferase family protein [Dictyostelium discoideum AX4]